MQQVIYEDIIKILPKGLVTIPKKLRLEVGLTEGGFVRITSDGTRLIVEPVTFKKLKKC